MARMHSKKKGKSGSIHPPAKIVPSWGQLSKDEVVETIIQLAKEGKSSSEIGLILRDQYGIPSIKTLLRKSVLQILKENNLAKKYPEDLMNLMRKAVRLRKHLEIHKQDQCNVKALKLVESKIKRLTAYYKSIKVLPENWYYKPEQAALIIKE